MITKTFTCDGCHKLGEPDYPRGSWWPLGWVAITLDSKPLSSVNDDGTWHFCASCVRPISSALDDARGWVRAGCPSTSVCIDMGTHP